MGLGSGPAALLLVPLLKLAAQTPQMHVSATQGPVELMVQQLRSRQLDAMVVDMRRVVPSTDLNIESLAELRAGFVVRAGHPLASKKKVCLAEIVNFPVASTPLSDEVTRLLIDQYGQQANPAEMVSLRSDDVMSLISTVTQTDAVFLGVMAAASEGLESQRLVEIDLKPKLIANARFAFVTLAGRTEAPAMAHFRQFVSKQLNLKKTSVQS